MNEIERLYSTLTKTALLVDDSDNRFFQRFNLGKTRFFTLVHLENHPGVSLSELCDLLLCTKGNATRILKSLENDGLLTREVDSEDNRALRIHLTPAGENLLGEVRKDFLRFNQMRFGTTDALARSALLKDLESLNNHLESIIRTF
jgi:MarR family 2-MHQ and catechol resistance regulon transcriptional repressor